MFHPVVANRIRHCASLLLMNTITHKHLVVLFMLVINTNLQTLARAQHGAKLLGKHQIIAMLNIHIAG